MDATIVELTDAQARDIDARLDAFDDAHMPARPTGEVRLGVVSEGALVAGVSGCMSAHRIFYVSTLFVDEAYRARGLGTRLMREVERRARQLGANRIRVDSFDWQGAGFYARLGYERVGWYRCEEDGYEEGFFLKRL